MVEAMVEEGAIAAVGTAGAEGTVARGTAVEVEEAATVAVVAEEAAVAATGRANGLN